MLKKKKLLKRNENIKCDIHDCILKIELAIELESIISTINFVL